LAAPRREASALDRMWDHDRETQVVVSETAIGRQNLSHWSQILLWSTELRVKPEDDQAS